jgi:hypothetical protein
MILFISNVQNREIYKATVNLRLLRGKGGDGEQTDS